MAIDVDLPLIGSKNWGPPLNVAVQKIADEAFSEGDALDITDATVALAVSSDGSATDAALKATYLSYLNAVKNPDLIISGAITRDANGAVTSAPVIWPDGTHGTFTADSLSAAFPGAIDGYHITYGSPATKTFTQPTITRDATGAATNVPAIVVS